MAKKSSLKTFLAGKNGEGAIALKNCRPIYQELPTEDWPDIEDQWKVDNEVWFVDVLDDGTAITYCAVED